ncbi:MAG: DEAD/DEAH box helicase [Nitrososphaerota archaeon]
MSLINSIIDCYHDLILSEYEKIKCCDFRLDDARSRLRSNEVSSIAQKHGLEMEKLLSQGLLIEYPDKTFRTLHMDLIFRIVNVRSASWTPKIPLEFKIPPPRIEYLPSFDEINLERIKEITKSVELTEILCSALTKSNYSGLAFHQFYFLKKLLSNKCKCYLLVAPTASGKSLIFYLTILIDVLQRLNENGTKAIILYPRKALASDQLFKFLKIIWAVNDKLQAKGLRKITIGLDDGDTPRSSKSEEVRRNEVFRGIKCIKSGCHGSLRYKGERTRTLIVCERQECNQIYDEIFATKEDIWSNSPDIVFSNIAALNRRMMMGPAQTLFSTKLKWIVFDEAHVYREELGGHVRWLLKRLEARFNVLSSGDVKFIISSATIPKPLLFAMKLTGFSKDEIYYESYEEVLKNAQRKFRKLTIDLILAPNPLRSAESLAEELALLFGVWSFTNLKKVILFVDNISEVERLYDFVVRTIILEREAHNDHLNPSITPSVIDITSPFSWRSFTRSISNINGQQLTGIYDFHHAELNPERRAEVEDRFKSLNKGLIFSTSTLELGIDIGDIAAIIQYKVPLTSESYVQRVGRAGRSEKVWRVALGILILTNSPSQVRFVYGNEYLRLIDPEQIDPFVEIPVAWENEEIKKQHLLFSILDVLAAKGHKTFLDYTTEIRNRWLDKDDIIDSLKQILNQARNEANLLLQYTNRLSSGAIRIVESLLKKIEEKISRVEEDLTRIDFTNLDENLLALRKAESNLLEALREIQRIKQNVAGIMNTTPIRELRDYHEKIGNAEELLNEVLKSLETLIR